MSRAGQATIETCVLIGMSVAALVTMNIYLQRGYQGYMRANAAAHGPQFDPRESTYTIDQTHHIGQHQDIDIVSGYEIVGQGIGQDDLSGRGGVPPQRSLGIRVRMDSDWDIERNAQWDVRNRP
jgi:hypothetical protein